jgi:hypothetical protein
MVERRPLPPQALDNIKEIIMGLQPCASSHLSDVLGRVSQWPDSSVSTKVINMI